MRKRLAILVENSPGVLTHISSMISGRAYNIETIAASSTEKEDITRISLVVDVADEWQLGQVVAQLEKMVQVYKVLDMNTPGTMSRELGLIKIKADASMRSEIIDVVNVFGARIIDFSTRTMLIELTAEGHKLDAFCKIMADYGIIEIIRTGEICLDTAEEAATSKIFK